MTIAAIPNREPSERHPGQITASIRPVFPDTDFENLLAGLHGTVFQSAHWLQSWACVWLSGEVEGFWLSVRDEEQRVLLAMPLIRRRMGAVLLLEGMDLGVSDYNAPLLSPDLPGNIPFAALWKTIRSALPKADLLRLHRMPALVGGLKNPLLSHPLATQNRLSAWPVALPQDWDAYLARLSSRTRDSLGKKMRRFARMPGARHRIAQSSAEALALMDELEVMQAQRISAKGLPYALNDGNIRRFYRHLAERYVAEGRVLVCALEAEEGPVAVNFAVQHQTSMTYLRLANKMGAWHPFSLGILVTCDAMRESMARGCGLFDFAMGDYAYKKKFGAEPVTLHDLVLPLSLRGVPKAALFHARNRLARIGLLRVLVGRVRGWLAPRQPSPRDGDALR